MILQQENMFQGHAKTAVVDSFCQMREALLVNPWMPAFTVFTVPFLSSKIVLLGVVAEGPIADFQQVCGFCADAPRLS